MGEVRFQRVYQYDTVPFLYTYSAYGALARWFDLLLSYSVFSMSPSSACQLACDQPSRCDGTMQGRLYHAALKRAECDCNVPWLSLPHATWMTHTLTAYTSMRSGYLPLALANPSVIDGVCCPIVLVHCTSGPTSCMPVPVSMMPLTPVTLDSNSCVQARRNERRRRRRG